MKNDPSDKTAYKKEPGLLGEVTSALQPAGTGTQVPSASAPSSLGRKIAALRQAASLTQKQLAEQAGLSQSTISKLENNVADDASFVDLGRISSALGVPLRELVENTRLAEFLGSPEEQFHAFCPNALCRSNELRPNRDNKTAVHYKSWKQYPASEFDVVNFCEYCGERLLKDCPSCGAYLRTPAGKFCLRCGSPVNDRPTAEEWERIRQSAPKDADIPF